ncbi:MFS transporter [Consotaella aegiceratis]|uniref:MFS transporter n=1 Tax=Consotaella aegiceratis TaxID=3097961 RepID=UPI002F3EA275
MGQTTGSFEQAIDAQGGKEKNASVIMFARLGTMMLLEGFVWGSWFATLGLVLATHQLPTIIGYAYSLAAVAAIVSPLFLGAIGDRFMASQKLLGIAHLLGAVLMLFVPSAVLAGAGWLVLLLIFAYMLLFQPTCGLINQIAFRHLDASFFPYIRLPLTIGWIGSGLFVGYLNLSASTGIFTVAGCASILFAVYAFTLPATPPAAKGNKLSFGDLIGARAFVLFQDRNFAILFVCVFLTSTSLGVYNTFGSAYLGALGIQNVAGVLAIGVTSELLFISTIPFVLKRIGVKWAMLLGMGMWGLRFTLFIAAAHGHASLAIASVALHGICNDFFLIISAMYVDRIAPEKVSAQAQSWLILDINGFGALIGSFAAGQIFGATVAVMPDAGPAAWTPIWLVPIGSAVITAVLWISLFRLSVKEEPKRLVLPESAQ